MQNSIIDTPNYSDGQRIGRDSEEKIWLRRGRVRINAMGAVAGCAKARKGTTRRVTGGQSSAGWKAAAGTMQTSAQWLHTWTQNIEDFIRIDEARETELEVYAKERSRCTSQNSLQM